MMPSALLACVFPATASCRAEKSSGRMLAVGSILKGRFFPPMETVCQGFLGGRCLGDDSEGSANIKDDINRANK